MKKLQQPTALLAVALLFLGCVSFGNSSSGVPGPSWSPSEHGQDVRFQERVPEEEEDDEEKARSGTQRRSGGSRARSPLSRFWRTLAALVLLWGVFELEGVLAEEDESLAFEAPLEPEERAPRTLRAWQRQAQDAVSARQ